MRLSHHTASYRGNGAAAREQEFRASKVMLVRFGLENHIDEIHNAQCIIHNEAGAVFDLHGRRISMSSVSSVPSVKICNVL